MSVIYLSRRYYNIIIIILCGNNNLSIEKNRIIETANVSNDQT